MYNIIKILQKSGSLRSFDVSVFYPACNVIDYAKKLAEQPSVSYQEDEQSDLNELAAVSRHIKANTCSWVS